MISDEMLDRIATLGEGEKATLDDHERRIATLEAKQRAVNEAWATLLDKGFMPPEIAMQYVQQLREAIREALK